jgi:hypothetical protein
MKIKAIVAKLTRVGARKALVIGLAGAVVSLSAMAVAFADNPHMGTWNLNEAKSKIPANAPKNHKVVYEAAGDSIKVTVDGTDAAGGATHNEWTGKFDGKPYPVSGDPTTDTRTYRKINSRTMSLTNKKGKKVVVTGTIVVSRDGKTRTVTTSGTDAKGKRIRTVAVYDKE